MLATSTVAKGESRWTVVASHRFGTPTDDPIHSPLTHGMASTHHVWLRDGSGVFVQDNIPEAVVLISRDRKEKARCRLHTSAHTFLTTSTGEILALVVGTIDGKILPSVTVLDGPSLKIVREILVPLAPDEPAKLHHGCLSSDGETIVVANMGPIHGEKAGTTVAALRWRTGKVLWNVPTVRNSGHVRFLDANRVIVLGHRDASLAILDGKTGKMKEMGQVPGATSLGHSLAEEASGTVLLIDSSAGRLVRMAKDGIQDQSPNLGKDVAEASLTE